MSSVCVLLRGLLCLLALCLCISLSAQRPVIDDFTLRGDTYLTEEDCFRLTEALDYSSGSIWYKHPISLYKPFSIELSVMLGCQDEEGADGMVFVFTPQTNQLGYVGEGIGFAGMVPSIGIEIDTWRNYHLYDPDEDHLALMINGRVGHYYEVAEPQLIPNIEDCTRHRLVVSWIPDNQEILVLIDRKEVLKAQVDLIGQVFAGTPSVYWGVTAATGRYNNIHEVCFDRISMYDPMPLDPSKVAADRARRYGK